MKKQQPKNLEQVIDKTAKAEVRDNRVSLGAILDAVGYRSFGPLLLLAGIITISPIGSIPGVPTIMGALVTLTIGQLLFRRKHIWMPKWLLKRSVDNQKLKRSLERLRKPSKHIDKRLRERFPTLVRGRFLYLIAVITILLSFLTPLMELVPYSVVSAGIVFALFGLAIIADDGLLALIGYISTLVFVVFGLLIIL